MTKEEINQAYIKSLENFIEKIKAGEIDFLECIYDADQQEISPKDGIRQFRPTGIETITIKYFNAEAAKQP